jgi:hypothetical protein
MYHSTKKNLRIEHQKMHINNHHIEEGYKLYPSSISNNLYFFFIYCCSLRSAAASYPVKITLAW